MDGKCGRCGYEDAAEGLVIALEPEDSEDQEKDLEGGSDFDSKIAEIERKLAELKRMGG